MPALPPHWDERRLEADRQLAIEQFRDERIGESLGAYLENFSHYRLAVERLLRTTADLADLAAQALAVIVDEDLFYVTRYLTGPPVSTDDLRILADARLTPSSVRTDTASARRAVETILRGLDRERFAWVAEQREPSIEERRIAVVATAAADRLTAGAYGQADRCPEAPRRAGQVSARRRRLH